MSEINNFVELIKEDVADTLDCDLLYVCEHLDTDIFDFGCDSLTTIQLVRKVESRFGIHISFLDLHQYNTVNKMAELVQNLLKEKIS